MVMRSGALMVRHEEVCGNPRGVVCGKYVKTYEEL